MNKQNLGVYQATNFDQKNSDTKFTNENSGGDQANENSLFQNDPVFDHKFANTMQGPNAAQQFGTMPTY